MSEFLTTKEVASYLRIKERKVYDLASTGKIPCSRATGKLLFPRLEIEQWVQKGQSPSSTKTQQRTPRPKVLLGSHDPLLEWALRESGCGIATFFDGSFDGLERYKAGEGIATGLHIFDTETHDWNTASAKDLLDQPDYVLIEWAKRQRGLVIANSQKDEIRSLRDLSGKTMVPRQAGAGSQRLLDSLLEESTINAADINFITAERTENDAVLPLLQNKADVTLGLQSIAEQYQLGFIPLIQERYDLLVNRREWFEPSWQTFLDFCRSERFTQKSQETIGYDFSEFGKIHLNPDNI